MAARKVESIPLLSPSELKAFTPLNRLDEKQLILLSSHHEILKYNAKCQLMAHGSADNKEYFLIEGKLKLTAKDGKEKIVEGGTEGALSPVAHLQPRMYDVKVLEKSLILQVDWNLLAEFMRQAPKPQAGALEESIISGRSSADLIHESFLKDLDNNQIILPTLPSVANKIKEIVNWEYMSNAKLSKIISKDPAMSIKIIAAANSPIYRGAYQVRTCEEAVIRLGMNCVKQLVNIYAVRELFGSKLKVFKKRMENLLRHSQNIAAISHSLANINKDVPLEEAMLAGLTHDIGAIPVLQYAEKHRGEIKDTEELDKIVKDLSPLAGQAMLLKWGWPQHLADVCTNAENWNYESGEKKANQTDIVIVAHLRAAAKVPTLAPEVPPPEVSSVASFFKIAKSTPSPEQELMILERIDEDTVKAKALLSG